MTCERFPLLNLTVSIVSHGQGHLVKHLLSDLQPAMRMGAQVILTLNIDEDEKYIIANENSPTIIRNQVRLGFEKTITMPIDYVIDSGFLC